MGIMGLMNSKDALGKDQHNSQARLRMAEKDTLLKANLGNDSDRGSLAFPQYLKMCL